MNRWLLLFVAVFALVGCSSDDDDTVTVFAAASLTDAFMSIESAFEDANPGVDVQLTLAGSSALREQLLDGAPGDVFASANQQNFTPLVEAGLVSGTPRAFASNAIQIGVPPGNPGGVASLADFANDDLLIGLCARSVPCGELGRSSLASAGVAAQVDTNEPNVRSLVGKIAAGELDAGLVYRTDVLSNDDIDGISLPAENESFANYPIAALAQAETSELSARFIDFVLSADGQRLLASHGFGPVMS